MSDLFFDNDVNENMKTEIIIPRNKIERIIRKSSRPCKNEDRQCFVCGSTNRIQSHHIIKVEQLVNFILENHLYELSNKETLNLENIYIPNIDLCESHHEEVHIIMGDLDGTIIIMDTEREKYTEMFNIKVPKEYESASWYSSFVDLIEDNRNKFFENMKSIENETESNIKFWEAINENTLAEYVDWKLSIASTIEKLGEINGRIEEDMFGDISK